MYKLKFFHTLLKAVAFSMQTLTPLLYKTFIHDQLEINAKEVLNLLFILSFVGIFLTLYPKAVQHIDILRLLTANFKYLVTGKQ